MDLLTIVGLIIFAPVAIRFVDRAYKSLKTTELYKDLADEES